MRSADSSCQLAGGLGGGGGAGSCGFVLPWRELRRLRDGGCGRSTISDSGFTGPLSLGASLYPRILTVPPSGIRAKAGDLRLGSRWMFSASYGVAAPSEGSVN